jgi:hypothetical protein
MRSSRRRREETMRKKTVASNPISSGGEEIKLIPGVYDLTVKNQEEAGNPTIIFAGITVEAGKTVEKVAEF